MLRSTGPPDCEDGSDDIRTTPAHDGCGSKDDAAAELKSGGRAVCGAQRLDARTVGIEERE